MRGRGILVVPLNWGLGHATRIIPLLKILHEKGNRLFVGGSPSHLALIKMECKFIETIDLPWLKVSINSKQNIIIQLISQLPRFLFQIYREHNALKKIVKDYCFDLIISDNCYGIYHKQIHSVIISHQTTIKLPGKLVYFQPLTNRLIRLLLSRFDECWIPDYESNGGLAGELSHANLPSTNIRYIGILSRFDPPKKNVSNKLNKNSLLIILSGPEPQRTEFERLIIRQLNNTPSECSYHILRGLPDSNAKIYAPGIWYNHLPAEKLKALILNSETIICRAGYSTIMDLVRLGRTAVLVPTPGQTEQEYLARYLSDKKYFCTMRQSEFEIREAIAELSGKTR